MKKIFSIFCLLLLCSTVAFAEVEMVEIASDITNGTVSYKIDGSTVTLTVTPDEGYYLETINAVKTMNVSNITKTRAEGPALGVYTLTRTSESTDVSATATYTFTLDKNLGAYVTAKFTARTEITADQLNLSASSFVYDRTSHVPSFTVGSLKSGTDFTVSYSEESPVDVGSYSLTVSGINRYKGQVKATWTITQRTLTIAAVDRTKVYGTADPELTYTVEGLVEGDALTGSLVRAEGETVGEYAITQGTLAASSNYNVSFTGAKFTITAATMDITVTPYAGTYDGKSHSIVVTIPSDATVKYGTSEGTYNMSEVPSYTSAGDYTVYYQVEKTNYATVTGNAKVTLSKKDATITAEDKTKVYGTTDPELTYTVEGLVESDALTGSLVRAEGESVGEYAITQGTLAASDNYNVSFTPAKFTITVATMDISVASYTGTYDGKPHSIVVTVASDATVKYGTAEGTYNMNEVPTYTAVGDYTVYYQVERPNYATVTGSAKVSISKKDATITAVDKTKVYGTADPELTYIVEGLEEGDALTGSLIRAEGESVGEYAITQGSLAASDNYNVSFTPAKLTITVATMDMTVASYTGTYDGKPHSIVVTVASDATVKYGTAEGTYDLSEVPTYTAVGEYTIYYQVERANYATATGSAKVSINKKDITITAHDKSKVYGTDDPEFTYTVEGLVEGEALTGVLVRAEGEVVGEYAITQGSLAASDNYNVSFTGAKFTITAATIDMTVTPYAETYDGKSHTIVVSVPSDATVKYGTTEGTYNMSEAPSYIDAGDYTIYYQVEKANYATVTSSAQVTIKKKNVTITAVDKTKVYGTEDPELTYIVEGLLEGETLTGALVRAEGESVGEYAITQGSLKASDNYNVSFTPAKFTITAATMDINVTPYTGTYDGKPHSIVVTVPSDATVKYGTAEGTYNLSEVPSYTAAGDYTVYYQVERPNYAVVTGSVKVTINKKDATITAHDKTKVAGEKDPELTYTVEGLVEGEALTGALVRAEGEAVGEYAITQGTLAASDNYNVSFTGAKFTITAPEKPAGPNDNVVNPENPVTANGKNFYPLNEGTKGAANINTGLALSPDASALFEVDENGNMKFGKNNENVEIMLTNQKAGDTFTMTVSGDVMANSDDLNLVNSSGNTRGTRAGSKMKRVSGAEYRVLHDGNIVLTVMLTEAPVTISSINVSSSTTGINLNPALSQEEGVWYDLNGRKFDSKPTKQGVYIHQGAKVVIK